MFRLILIALLAVPALGCATMTPNTWNLALAHDRDGNVTQGDVVNIANAVRRGCRVRIAWGARRAADPSRTIEHVADATWISVVNEELIRAEVDGFMANLAVLGEPSEDHPRMARFGGTEKAVLWRATLSSDGRFDAIWYGATDGELKVRIPQRQPMRWYADCAPGTAPPLYPDA
ncbi:MAG: hypothetical protein AAFU65_06085 [Pseudomonadota bacterium]